MSVGLFEWSADPELDIDDRLGWVQANPDLGHGRMTERDIQAEREAKEDDQFRTENLCQWVDDLQEDEFEPRLSEAELTAMTISDVAMDSLKGWVLCVDGSTDRRVCSVAVAARHKKYGAVGKVVYHGELKVESVLAAVHEAIDTVDPGKIYVDPKGTAQPVAEALVREGSEVIGLTWPNIKAATGAFFQGQRDGTMHLIDDRGLIADAFKYADTKRDINGGERWIRHEGQGIISQLTAVSYAMWAAQNAEDVKPVPRPPSGVSMAPVKRARPVVKAF